MRKINVLFFLLCASALSAQLPDTDIWLFQLGKTKKGIILKEGKNITAREGYDNQPFFTPDGKSILFSSIREDKQADIYRYDLGSKKILRVTQTTTSEYSPMLTPDGKKVSVVMVEADSTQRIWSFDYPLKKDFLVTEKFQSLVTEKEDSIGYYSWLNRDSLLYYKLTDPHSLRAYSLSTGKDTWLCDNPARSFRPVKNGSFFYVVKRSENNEVRLYQPRLKKSDALTTTGKEIEDFIYDKNLGLVKSEGSKLMRYDEKLKTWLEVADLSLFGIKKITRFAISSNGKWLAVVENK